MPDREFFFATSPRSRSSIRGYHSECVPACLDFSVSMWWKCVMEKWDWRQISSSSQILSSQFGW